MAKESSSVPSRMLTSAPSATLTTAKTTLTAAISKTLSENDGSHGSARADFTAFENIDRGSRKRERGITISIAHISTRRIPATTLTSTALVTLTTLRT